MEQEVPELVGAIRSKISSRIFQSQMMAGVPEVFRGSLMDQLVSAGGEIFLPTWLAVKTSGLNVSGVSKGSEMGRHMDYLDKCFEKMVECRLEGFVRAIGRIKHVCKMLDGELGCVSFAGGDPHNGGQETMVFEGGGKKFVYKPTFSTPQSLLLHVLGMVCSELGVIDIERAAPIISVETDWYARGFVESSDVVGAEDCDRFYFIFGALCVVALALRFIDLHFENLVNFRGVPIPIDAEFMMAPSIFKVRGRRIEETGLLGSFVSAANGISDFSVIGLSIRRSCNLVQSVGYTFPQHFSQHLPVLIDGVKDIGGCRGKFKEGVCWGYDFLLSHEEEILRVCEAAIEAPGYAVRSLVRNSSMYKVLQLALFTPSPLSVDERVNLVKKRLRNRKSILINRAQSGFVDWLVEMELQDLESGDIPFFWMGSDPGMLFHKNGIYAFSNRVEVPQAVLRKSFGLLRKKGRRRVVAELSKSLNNHCRNIRYFRMR